jgi:signal transduction histidine kinase
MIVSAAWVVPAILGAIHQLALHGDGWNARVLAGAGDWLIYALLTPFVFLFSRRLPMLRPHLWRKFTIHLVAALLFCVAWAGAGTMLKAVVLPNSLPGGAQVHFTRWLFLTLPFGVAVYLGLVASEHGLRYYVETRERETQMARLSEQLSQARLAALQASVHPHFLFNTLNTIGVLVRDGDRRAATRVLDDLSVLLRRMLGRHRAPEVPLGEELEVVQHYLAIEQARFSDRLRAEFVIDGELRSVAVPSFAVQHLVENAVRHGIAHCSDAGRIVIRARRDGEMLEVAVVDDGIGVAAGARGGDGLENTRERLRELHRGRGSLVVESHPPRGTVATMRLPCREAGVSLHD